MFTLKSCCKTEIEILETSAENLSSYDINAIVTYGIPLDNSDYVMLRYVGEDGESSLEVSVVDGMIEEVGLRCFNKKAFVNIDSPWTWPENIEAELKTYKITMNDKNFDVKVSPNRIDLYQNFSLSVYSDAVVFVLENQEVYRARVLGERIVVLLDMKENIVGYSILSDKHALMFADTYK